MCRDDSTYVQFLFRFLMQHCLTNPDLTYSRWPTCAFLCDFLLITESHVLYHWIFSHSEWVSTAETDFLFLRRKKKMENIVSRGFTIHVHSVGSFAPERWGKKAVISRRDHKVSKVAKYSMSAWILGTGTKWCMNFFMRERCWCCHRNMAAQQNIYVIQ